jgi:hypothetical protein
MKAVEQKIREALLLTKTAAEDLAKESSQLDPAWAELGTALACLGRARRLLRERPEESSEVAP